MKKRERGDESQEGTFIWGWRTKTDQTRERRKTTKAAKREGRTDTRIHSLYFGQLRRFPLGKTIPFPGYHANSEGR